MNKTIGILAHVDAGKTTFSEQILFHTNTISSVGRVDNKNSFLDINEIERARGITIFADQASFSYHNSAYFLIDTPGHIDFFGETERAISVMDYAILIINGVSGIQSYTQTLFHLLTKYKVPVFFFINKMDQIGADLENILEQIKTKLTKSILFFPDKNSLCPLSEELKETIAETDDMLLEKYLENTATDELFLNSLKKEFKACSLYPCMCGSALFDKGIDDFLSVFDQITFTDYNCSKPFLGQVYKIRHEANKTCITFIKALEGTLKVKEELNFLVEGENRKEKINQIRFYNGEKFITKQEVKAGEIFAVTGLSIPSCGAIIGHTCSNLSYELQPALKSTLVILDNTDTKIVLDYLALLEKEEPMLNVQYEAMLKEIQLHIMGKIQLEVLKEYLKNRFSLMVDFAPPEVLYMETIASSVMGYGHFEPLRHYAEVNLKLEPNPHYAGISFESQCSTDYLPHSFQNLIRTHIFEKQHKGILTGSPLTNLKITLIAGRFHIKHTEGGDFREATYRAIRQGLEKAENILLEPYYKFDIFIEPNYIGKVLSSIQRLYGTFSSPSEEGNLIHIVGKGPVSEFMEYSHEFISSTKGTGTIYFQLDGYDICHNSEEVIKRKAYQKEADIENTSSSVFCAKGQSFLVPWDKAETYMHCL